MIATPLDVLERRAAAWAASLGSAAAVTDGRSMVGGGSLPEESLPTRLLALHLPDPTAAAATLRRGEPPIVARIERELLLLDPRTVDPDDDAAVADAVGALADA